MNTNTPITSLDADLDEDRHVTIIPKRRRYVPGQIRNAATALAERGESPADARPTNNADVTSASKAEGAKTTSEGASLFDEIAKTIREFVKLERHQYEAVTLWLVASRCIKFLLVHPILYFSAPCKESGKTKALDIVGELVQNPVRTSDITAPAVYRAIDANAIDDTLPTILLDNAHLNLRENSRMAAVLSGGFDRSFAKSIVSGYRDGVVDGIDEFSLWSAKGMAGNGVPPFNLGRYSIVIWLVRKLGGEPILQVAYERVRLAELRKKINSWFSANATRIQAELRMLSDGRDNRVGDKWAAMLAVARVAGGDWEQKARKAMLLIERSDDDSMDTHELVLNAVQRYFREHDGSYALSEKIVAWMNADPEAPWSSFGKRGEPFSVYNLRDSLAKFQVRATNVEPVTRRRGYRRADLQPIFDRYPLPDDELGEESGPISE